MIDKNLVLKSLIGRYFKDEFYSVSIGSVRKAIKERPFYKDSWDSLIRLVLFKELPDGEALKILDIDGNLILHEYSDEEAYRWLMLMIINVSRGDDEPILDEREFLSRDKGSESI